MIFLSSWNLHSSEEARHCEVISEIKKITWQRQNDMKSPCVGSGGKRWGRLLSKEPLSWDLKVGVGCSRSVASREIWKQWNLWVSMEIRWTEIWNMPQLIWETEDKGKSVVQVLFIFKAYIQGLSHFKIWKMDRIRRHDGEWKSQAQKDKAACSPHKQKIKVLILK
jgi:hypothetical protein